MDVLILDSSVQVLDRLQELLSENKYIAKIDKTTSYDDATKMVLEMNHKIILLDGELPKNATAKFLKRIKKAVSHVSVIVLYHRYDEYRIMGLKLNGADFLIDKFYEFEKITGMVNSIGEENK